MMTRLLAFLLLLITVPSYAADSWYQVNLVVFENRNTITGGEKFDAKGAQPQPFPADMVDLAENNTAPANQLLGFRELPINDDQFKTAVNILQHSSAYKVLSVMSWREPALDQDKAIPVLIQAGDKFGTHYRVEGIVTLVVSRYLHLDTDLWWGDYVQVMDDSSTMLPEYTDSPSPQAPVGSLPLDTPDGGVVNAGPQVHFQATQLVRMQESRRMRSGELHYLDNPLFGLLVKVVPLDVTTDPKTGQPMLAPPPAK